MLVVWRKTDSCGRFRSREGQLKVIGHKASPATQRPRSLPPRATRSTIRIEESQEGASRSGRSEKERRRRDRMSSLLEQLTEDENSESAEAGKTKCDILEKACEYITELREINEQLAEIARHKEALAAKNELLRKEIKN
ncbi:hypothetical protein R5R35_011655 [Gryllus longicercus]|uniref:BHLH domain-containing protein n=1 Tax=Gryllus longicercus TaxID=2509291 RepID=A0AAN9VN33_9ORTH